MGAHLPVDGSTAPVTARPQPFGAALVIAWVVGGLAAARPAQAQELRIGVARVDADHDLLGTSTGLNASIGAGLTSKVGVRLGIQHGGVGFSSLGSTCVGLVPPDEDCSPERRAEESTTTALVVSVPLRASVGWGTWGSFWRSDHRPARRGPCGHASLVRRGVIADGYTPFEETVRLIWVEAGVSVRERERFGPRTVRLGQGRLTARRRGHEATRTSRLVPRPTRCA